MGNLVESSTSVLVISFFVISFLVWIWDEIKKRQESKKEWEELLRKRKEREELERKKDNAERKREELERKRKKKELERERKNERIREAKKNKSKYYAPIVETRYDHLTQKEKGDSYEKYIGKKLESKGQLVIYNGFIHGYDDEGVDIISISPTTKTINLIQCKNWTNMKMELSHIQEIYKKLNDYDVSFYEFDYDIIKKFLQIDQKIAIDEVLEKARYYSRIQKTLYIATTKNLDFDIDNNLMRKKYNIYHYKDMDVVADRAYEKTNPSNIVNENWMEKLWTWADENGIQNLDWQCVDYHTNVGSEIGFPRDKNRLLDMTKLQIPGNLLREVPREIGNLSNLTSLGLFTNELTELPEEIGQLSNLKYLYLAGNKLVTLPKEIGQLTNLNDLNLNNNELKELPKEIVNLTNLRFFVFCDNPNLILTKEQKHWIKMLKLLGCEVGYSEQDCK